MDEDPSSRRADRAARAEQHAHAQRRRKDQESAKAQVLVDRFVAQAVQADIPAEKLKARPWSGSGRYPTDVVGWYVRRDLSVGVSVDGGYYVLLVPPVRLGRWRTVHVEASPPPLVVGEGGRDGDAVGLEKLLQLRLDEWGS